MISLESYLHSLILDMPPIWKILIIAAVCLGIVPSFGSEDSEPGASEIVTMDGDIHFNTKQNTTASDVRTFVEPIKSDEFDKKNKLTDEAIPKEAVLNIEPNASVQEQEPKSGEPESTGVLMTADSSVLESVGIKKLSKGINIFRFSTYYLKHESPLVRGRTLPENSIQ